MSHIPRLFVESQLENGHRFALPMDQSKYLLRVMRLADGQMVRAFNGRDGEWTCKLTIEGKTAILVADKQLRPQSSGQNVTLLFAPIKKARTDFIVEKATELGVRRLQPVFTEYTQSQRVREDRMRSLAIEAAEQTERMDIPEIEVAASLGNVLDGWDPSIPLLFCDEGAAATPMHKASDKLSGKPVAILVGPEGGFSENERERLRALEFVIPVTLGPRVLRAETAVVSALSLWQSLFGDWNESPYLPET